MRIRNTYAITNGSIDIDAEVEHNVIISIKIKADAGATDPAEFLSLLERHLRGVELRRDYVTNAVNVFYLLGVKTDKITKEQFIDAIMGLRK